MDASKSEGQPFHSALFSETIKDSHVGRFREALSEAELAQVERECEPLLTLLARAPSIFTVEPHEETVTRDSLSRLQLYEFGA